MLQASNRDLINPFLASQIGPVLTFIETASAMMSTKDAHRVSAILGQLGAQIPWSTIALDELSAHDRQLVIDAQHCVNDERIMYWSQRVT
jgi:hypothetical protein